MQFITYAPNQTESISHIKCLLFTFAISSLKKGGENKIFCQGDTFHSDSFAVIGDI